jgi:hypothetical protein
MLAFDGAGSNKKLAAACWERGTATHYVLHAAQKVLTTTSSPWNVTEPQALP